MLESTENTGDGIFSLIDNEFSKLGISWDNCISFCCDNASTMTGRFKGVAAFIKSKQENTKIVGCPCHLVHLAAQKATKVLPVDIENLLVQIFYYLEKSSKRKNALKGCQDLCDLKAHKILKHVNTRWLSLEMSLRRVVENWEALKMFFSDDPKTGNKNDQFCVIKEQIQCPKTKLYCLFLLAVIPVFTRINVALQKEQPCIQILQKQLHKLYFDLIVRFVKPTAISKAESLYKLDFKKMKCQKDDGDLIIGSTTRSYLKDVNLLSDEVKEFYTSVRSFFSEACDYILKKFPLEDEFFKHAAVADIHTRMSASYDSVKYFANLFKCYEDNDELEIEFAYYQNDQFPDDIMNCERMDVAWDKISRLLDVDGNPKYKTLPSLMLSILIVPHSNAPTERLFSMLRKNKTEFRSSLSTKMLEALLIEKQQIVCCYDKTFSNEELKMAKSACYKELAN